MVKKILLFIFSIGLIVAISLVGLYFTKINSSVSDSEEIKIFSVKSGEGVKVISANLKDEEIINSSYIFEWYVYLGGSESKFLAGDYELMASLNIKEVVEIMTLGQSQAEIEITIIEGWKSDEIDKYLASQDIIERGAFIAKSNIIDTRTIIVDKEYSFLDGKPSNQGLEGYLFPDTYRIFKDSTSVDIIKRMLNNFETKFTDQMKQDSEIGNMTVYEIITLASIIEKEVSNDEDRKNVASVFYNRLNNGMGLQSDATVNYVTKEDRPQPTLEDLEVDSPYNTYMYRDLPPGPISNPSLSSIMAAIYPADTNYFYFLNKINDDGSTVFSNTYDEHLNNKAKYLN
ncbi:MAG: endolytic transglycosylase MltG [Candidatus Kerfeldbacteria bacterium]